MLKQLFKVPKKCYVACSGGSDSMAILDFLRKGQKVLGAVYFDHKTPQSFEFFNVVKRYCNTHSLDVVTGQVNEEHKNASIEAFWSKCRNDFFKSLKVPIITGHNLDDAVEWWIFTSLRGNPSLMPVTNENILRPFLITKKKDLHLWSSNNKIKFANDESNNDTRFTRNFIRHTMMKNCLIVNPGIQKTILKKIIERQKNALKTG
jgi:tRNA(Ile)-lysidine synthase